MKQYEFGRWLLEDRDEFLPEAFDRVRVLRAMEEQFGVDLSDMSRYPDQIQSLRSRILNDPELHQKRKKSYLFSLDIYLAFDRRK